MAWPPQFFLMMTLFDLAKRCLIWSALYLLLSSTSWKMYDFSVSFTSMTMEYWDKKLSLFSALYRPGESIVLNRHFPPRLRPLDGSCYSRQSHHSLRNRHRCTVHGQAPSPGCAPRNTRGLLCHQQQ